MNNQQRKNYIRDIPLAAWLLCYGSMVIMDIFTLTVRGSILVVRIWCLQTSDSDVCRHQILTSTVDPRTIKFKPSRCIKASFCISEELLNFLKPREIRTKIVMELCNNNNIFVHLTPSSSHLHPLQIENCDSHSRLVVDEDDHDKFKLERING